MKKASVFKKSVISTLLLPLIIAAVIMVLPQKLYAAEELSITVGPEFTIEDGGSSIRHFPFLAAFDDKVFVNFSQHGDNYIDHPVDGMRISSNDGATWPTYIQNQDFYLTSMIKLGNGQLFGISYIDYYVDARHSTMHYWKSPDNGATWNHYTGTVTFPQDIGKFGTSNWASMVFHRTMMEMPDGSLQGVMYGRYASDSKYRVLWVKSTDGGANWSVVSTVAHSTTIGSEGFCEPVVARVADGSLLCVMRVGSNYPLYQCRSLDNGLTWSVPTTLPGIEPAYTYSVDPDLCLMSNGTLALSYGRPNCRILFSADGSGYSWGNLTSTYASTTSGYTGIKEVAPNRLMVISDKGAQWQSPSSYIIWGKYIDVVRTNVTGKKIDLLAKYNAGQVTVSTDMTYTDSANPGMKVSGAFDNSVNYGYSAFKPNATWPSYYTIALDKTYNIKTLGICLKPGYEETAYIYFSADGVNWGTHVKSYTNANLMGVDYTTFTNPDPRLAARYIKVNVTSSGGWPGLNEIQLFYDDNTVPVSDTFENDTAGQVPAGYTEVGPSGTVSTTRAYQEAKSLRVYDSAASVLTNVVKTTEASSSKVLEFNIYPVAAPTGNVFSINGGGNDNAQSAFHFNITSDGSLKWYNGSAWNNVSGVGTIQFNQWNKIRVGANNTSTAAVFVNGTYKGSAGKYNTVSMMDRVRFMSGSTGGTGDDFYVDNVYFN